MPTFKLQCISKSFSMGKESFLALNSISLTFPNKGLISISGKSGSGKSTLLNILMGIEKPDEGNLFFNNKRINKQSDSQKSFFHLHQVSMIYQHYNLFDNLTALENVLIPLYMQGLSKSEATKKAKDLFYELDIEELMNNKVINLSGGEKQRVAIIRALAIKPLVLLCDEPTGALDTKNGDEIMKILKKLSKRILVIMVSHNQEQIEKYSDRKIVLDEGKIKSDTKELRFAGEFLEKKKGRYSSKWSNKILLYHLKSNLKKNICSYLILSFGFVASLVSVGFIFGSSASFDNVMYSSLSVEYATISKETIYEVANSPLNLVKVVRPDYTDLDVALESIQNISISNNYDYVFSSYPETTFRKSVIDSPNLVPVYTFKNNEIINNLLVTGKAPFDSNIEEVVVNEQFVKQLNLNNESIIGNEIVISFSNELSIVTSDKNYPIIRDDISYNLSLIIRGVIKEFGFLNTPKVYYSTLALESFLKAKSMMNYSTYLGYNVSVKDYLDNVSNDSPASSYSYNVFVDNKSDILSMYELFNRLKSNENDIKINSTYLETYKSYRDLLDSFSTTLIIFIIICLLGLCFILAMIGLSTFIEKKKESAILSTLGAKSRDIISLFLSELHLVIVLSFISAVFLSIPITKLLNKVFASSYGLTNLFNIPYLSFYNIPLLLPIGLLFIFIIISSIFIVVPISIYKAKSLSDELRDE